MVWISENGRFAMPQDRQPRRQPSPEPASPAEASHYPAERFCEVVTPRPARMTKESKVRAITIAVIALAALIVIGRKADWNLPGSAAGPLTSETEGPARPQDVIYRMLDAAGQGDTAAYLSCYSGALRRRLEQSRDEMTPAGFARYLAQTDKQIKGIAISEPVALSQGEVEVRVEFVYQDRNEAQQFVLEASTGEWRIARVTSAERVDTPVPYGTPVY